ncbi:hypothetical protein [Parolsenella catena]|uniref:hypothetical protein n=1 Tax=Parolsenella catena TaxID=2003188 RepID=UPI003A8F55CA
MSSRYGKWPEEDPRRCDGCRFAERVERVMSASGDASTVYRCARRPEFVHETQAKARCNYWEAR